MAALRFALTACVLFSLTAARAADLVFLEREHCDFLIQHRPDETRILALVLRDEDRGVNYHANEVVLVVPEAARLSLPPGTPFGEEGDPIWALPQSQDRNLLYLGFSAEGVSAGAFSGPLNIRLKSVDGPGHFFAWQAAEFGNLNIKMNSRDGIGEDDRTTPIAGSHEHFNFGFSAPGVYQVAFQVEGRLPGSATNALSEISSFTFHVLPLPEELRLRVIFDESRDGLLLEITGAEDAICRLEFSEDLDTWQELRTIQLQTGRATIPLPGGGQRLFVRAAYQ